MTTRKVAVSFAAVTAVTLAACGRSSTSSMDDGLKQDLAAVGGSGIELAPKSANQQMVVSAIEGGPTSAPARTSTTRPTVQKPVVRSPRHPVATIAEAPPAQAPSPAPVIVAPAPVEATPVEPPPLPPAPTRATTRQQSRQAGPYKTEAEIFRQMPWIRP